ncbi:MAG: SPFH domain-containing protein [Candidatus Dormibacteria bacterium]
MEGAVDPGIIAAIVGGSCALIVLASGLRIIREYQRGVVLRFGRRGPMLEPGLRFILPLGIDRLTKVDLRSAPLDVPAHEVITRDGVPVRVSAAVHLQVLNPLLAVTRVLDYRQSTAQIVHAALRDVVATAGLREVLLNQKEMGEALAHFVDARTEPWGIRVTAVDLEDVVLPDALQRAMARRAEDAGDRPDAPVPTRAASDVAHQLEAAAAIIAGQPREVQIRFLQTLSDVHDSGGTMVVVPLPVELVQRFVDLQGRALAPRRSAEDEAPSERGAFGGGQPS